MRNWETFTRTTGIYRILNKKTNLRYIGNSKDIAGRWKSHLYQLRIRKHHCSYLQNSFNIHGFQDFSFEVVEVCKQEELSYREWVNWIVEDMVFGTFNSSPVNPILPGVIHTEETKEKMSAARRGKLASAETKENMSAARRGKKRKPFTGETRAKMSASKKGKSKSEEAKAKMSAAKKGKLKSEETKAKISAAKKGRKHTAEAKENMSAALKGRIFSEEHKAKLSENKKEYYRKKRLAEEGV